ncbi:MAG TPA: flagellar motor protein MotB [Syntrophomonas sp.]|nr:flagellar motor protein MotB [Syntrophomonas sp.]
MRRGRRKSEESSGEGGMERWLLSYADFITLLMVFFIMMYALSKVDVAKYNAIAQSLSVVLTGSTIQELDDPGPSLAPGVSGKQTSEQAIDLAETAGQLAEVQKQIEKFISIDKIDGSSSTAGQSSTKLADYIDIIEQERGLVISIKDTLLFPSGSDELNPQAQVVIEQLGKALDQVPNQLRVEGHTDDLAINTEQFPSNWELSVARATTVLHVLQKDVGIDAQRLSVGGYGEFKPLVPNTNAANRSKNRRVDIVILKQKYSEF